MTAMRLLLGIAALGLFAGGLHVAAAEEAGIVRSALAGMVTMPAPERSKKIAVEVVGDAAASEALQQKMVSLGYQAVVVSEGTTEWRLQVSPIYFGRATDRPPVGAAEHQERTVAIGPLLPNLWNSIGYALRPEAGAKTLILDVAGRASGVKDALDRRVEGRVSKKPVDALVMRAKMIGPSGTQQAEILTESFAEGVPLDALVADNVKLLVWLLE